GRPGAGGAPGGGARAKVRPAPDRGGGKDRDQAGGGGGSGRRAGIVARHPRRSVDDGGIEEAVSLRSKPSEDAARRGGISEGLRRHHEPHRVAGPRLFAGRRSGRRDVLGEDRGPHHAPPHAPSRPTLVIPPPLLSSP